MARSEGKYINRCVGTASTPTAGRLTANAHGVYDPRHRLASLRTPLMQQARQGTCADALSRVAWQPSPGVVQRTFLAQVVPVIRPDDLLFGFPVLHRNARQVEEPVTHVRVQVTHDDAHLFVAVMVVIAVRGGNQRLSSNVGRPRLGRLQNRRTPGL